MRRTGHALALLTYFLILISGNFVFAFLYLFVIVVSAVVFREGGREGDTLPLRQKRLAEQAVCGSLTAFVGLSFMFRGYASHNQIMATVGIVVGILGVLWLLPMVVFYRRNRIEARRLANGQCRNCGYDLRGSTGPICSECGHIVGELGSTHSN